MSSKEEIRGVVGGNGASKNRRRRSQAGNVTLLAWLRLFLNEQSVALAKPSQGIHRCSLALAEAHG